MTYLLDTNVVSELRKTQRDENVVRWFDATVSVDLYLSVLVVGEIRQGIERLRRRRDDEQADLFEAWLSALREEFTDRLLAVSAPIAEQWGRLNAIRLIPVVDGLLAATAIEHDLVLVTRDSALLDETGARTLNPWVA